MGKRPLLNVLAVLIILVVIFFVYRLVFKPAPGELASDEIGLVAAGFSDGDGRQAATDEFLGILLSLQQLDLTVGKQFFSDPVFQSLVDFSTTLRDQQPGRDNPFSPTLLAPPSSVFDSERASSDGDDSASAGPDAPAGASSQRSQLRGTH
ncbi:MAG: hypothetical protein U9M92_03360 [Patescibacteria group bacterium]|nr:hypothetical protein [Patescibacteria group bacterium]